VKNAAISSLSQCLKMLAIEKICNFILPSLTKTYADSSHIFKAGVALALCEMAPLVGKEYTEQRIMAVIQELMKSDNQECRINCVTNLIKVAGVLGQQMVKPLFMD